MPKPKKKYQTKPPPSEKAAPDDNMYKSPPLFKNITFTSDLIAPINNNNYSEKTDQYIPIDRLKMGNLMGRGEFASVFEGHYTRNNGEVMKVAIKMLHREQIEANRDSFMREAQVMMNLNHHCVVKLIGLSVGPQLLMVQELVALGSMLDYIRNNKDHINPKYEFTVWAAQIACGMYFWYTNN